MTEPYKTSLTEMSDLIDRANTIQRSLEATLDQIEKRVADMHVDWQGNAATAHQDAHKRWLKAARDMHEDLKSMRGETARAHQIYSGLVDHNRGMWPKG